MTADKLQKAMIEAMKARDAQRKEAISLLVAAVKKNAIDAGCRDDIPEEMVDSTILKELNATKEQIDELMNLNGADIIEEFAPKLLSAEEIETILKEKFADVIATKNRGLIMKTVMAELKGKADGKLISETVAKLCK